MPDKPETFGDLIPNNRIVKQAQARKQFQQRSPKPAPVDDCPAVQSFIDGTGWNRHRRFLQTHKIEDYRPVTETDLREQFQKRFPAVQLPAPTPSKYDAVCNNCGKPTVVTFQPTGPVICPDCLHGTPLPEAVEQELVTLADEAEAGTCEICNKEDQLDKGVCCEGCAGFFCRCCWFDHKCETGQILSFYGKIVQLGDRMKYHDGNKRVWTVTQIEATFKKFGICHGSSSGDLVLPIRPRLMMHV